ncbi:MAG TPA: hypothetical protein VKQ70_12875, partial [Caulobacteraceae bacterium]|nr:hypothetical protein [Caulobacteraceae bacterium]
MTAARIVMGFHAGSLSVAELQARLLATRLGEATVNLVVPPLPDPALQPYDAVVILPEAADFDVPGATVDTFSVREIVERDEAPRVAGTRTQGVKLLPFVQFKPTLAPGEGHRR